MRLSKLGRDKSRAGDLTIDRYLHVSRSSPIDITFVCCHEAATGRIFVGKGIKKERERKKGREREERRLTVSSRCSRARDEIDIDTSLNDVRAKMREHSLPFCLHLASPPPPYSPMTVSSRRRHGDPTTRMARNKRKRKKKEKNERKTAAIRRRSQRERGGKGGERGGRRRRMGKNTIPSPRQTRVALDTALDRVRNQPPPSTTPSSSLFPPPSPFLRVLLFPSTRVSRSSALPSIDRPIHTISCRILVTWKNGGRRRTSQNPHIMHAC